MGAAGAASVLNYSLNMVCAFGGPTEQERNFTGYSKTVVTESRMSQISTGTTDSKFGMFRAFCVLAWMDARVGRARSITTTHPTPNHNIFAILSSFLLLLLPDLGQMSVMQLPLVTKRQISTLSRRRRNLCIICIFNRQILY
jgi:hypothetical protein